MREPSKPEVNKRKWLDGFINSGEASSHKPIFVMSGTINNVHNYSLLLRNRLDNYHAKLQHIAEYQLNQFYEKINSESKQEA